MLSLSPAADTLVAHLLAEILSPSWPMTFLFPYFESEALMFSVEALSSYVLTLGLLTVFVLVWVTRQQKTKKDATTWLISGIAGVLLGAAGAMAGTYALGYQVTEPPPPVAVADSTPSAPPSMGGGGAPGGPSGGMGGGMGGMMGGGMGGMMGGGGQGPRPKQQLTTLVRKLELLTGDIALSLTDEQRQSLAKQLDEFAEIKTLTDDEAEKKYNDLLALFDDAQKAKQEAIGLPFRRGGGGGGAPPAPDANPFESEANANSLKSLRERLTAK